MTVSLESLRGSLCEIRQIPTSLRESSSAIANEKAKSFAKIVESLADWTHDVEESTGRKAQRFPSVEDVKLCVQLLFEASELAEDWLKVAQRNRQCDEILEELLNIVRLVPNHVASLLQSLRKMGDQAAQLCICALKICAETPRMGGAGRRCGDPKTLHHTLDLIFRIYKLNHFLKKVQNDRFDQVANEWIASLYDDAKQNMAINNYSASLGKKLFSSKTQTDFINACYALVRSIEFDSEEEPAVSIPCSGIIATVNGKDHELGGFANNDLGVGRYSMNAFGGDSPIWLDIPLWKIRRAGMSNPNDQGRMHVLEVVTATCDGLRTLFKTLGIKLEDSDEIVLKFQLHLNDKSLDVVDSINRRRIRFTSGERMSVSRVAINVSLLPPPQSNHVDFPSQYPSTRKSDIIAKIEAEKPKADAKVDELPPSGKEKLEKTDLASAMDDGDGKPVKDTKHQRVVDRQPKAVSKPTPKNARVDPSIYSSYTLRVLQPYCLAHYPADFYNQLFEGKVSKQRKSDIVKAMRDYDTKGGRNVSEATIVPPERAVTRDSDVFVTPNPKVKLNWKLTTEGKTETKTPKDLPNQPSEENKHPDIVSTVEVKPNCKRRVSDLDEFDFLGNARSIAKRGSDDLPLAKQDNLANVCSHLSEGPHASGTKDVNDSREPADAEKVDPPNQASSTATRKTQKDSLPLAIKKAEKLLLPDVVSPMLPKKPEADVVSFHQSIKTPTNEFVTPMAIEESRPQKRNVRTDLTNRKPSSGHAGEEPRRRKRVITFRDDDHDESDTEFHSIRKRLLTSFNKTDGDQSDYYDEENEMFELEANDVREEVFLECDRSIRAIRRVVQKVNVRRARSSKQIERRVRALLASAAQDVEQLNVLRATFTQEYDEHCKLVRAAQENVAKNKSDIAARNQIILQIKADTDKANKEIGRLRKESQDLARQFALVLRDSGAKQVAEIQKLVQKQKKEAKDWRSMRIDA